MPQDRFSRRLSDSLDRWLGEPPRPPEPGELPLEPIDWHRVFGLGALALAGLIAGALLWQERASIPWPLVIMFALILLGSYLVLARRRA